MISYDPLWKTMKQKGLTTYALIKNFSFSRGTLDSLKQNRNISTATLNDPNSDGLYLLFPQPPQVILHHN